jgi:2-dehydro-3-deoxygalactonokinase
VRGALIAIDWGTTHARAYLLDRDGESLGARDAPLGVQHVTNGDFAGALATLLGDWAGLAIPRIACGMIGSRQGWVEARYLECPARFTDLASGLARTPGGELFIVPGVLARDAGGIPDVIRGEETQLAGTVGDRSQAIAVLPGTHSKWARVDDAAIVDFRTFMTGELYSALLDHTIIGRLADRGSHASDEDAFSRGVARGLGDGELAHDVFGARTLALTGALSAAQVPEWLSGLLIGREVRAARAWAGNSAVRVIGSDALVLRYRRAFAQAGVACEPGPADAAVRGLWTIARAAHLVS